MGWQVLRLGEGRGGRQTGWGGGEGEPQKHIKVYEGVGGIKLVNIERTHFLNGPHPKIVDFIYFNENPLKMMNVPYLIWQALYYKKTAW